MYKSLVSIKISKTQPHLGVFLQFQGNLRWFTFSIYTSFIRIIQTQTIILLVWKSMKSHFWFDYDWFNDWIAKVFHNLEEWSITIKITQRYWKLDKKIVPITQILIQFKAWFVLLVKYYR